MNDIVFVDRSVPCDPAPLGTGMVQLAMPGKNEEKETITKGYSDKELREMGAMPNQAQQWLDQIEFESHGTKYTAAQALNVGHSVIASQSRRKTTNRPRANVSAKQLAALEKARATKSINQAEKKLAKLKCSAPTATPYVQTKSSDHYVIAPLTHSMARGTKGDEPLRW